MRKEDLDIVRACEKINTVIDAIGAEFSRLVGIEEDIKKELKLLKKIINVNNIKSLSADRVEEIFSNYSERNHVHWACQIYLCFLDASSFNSEKNNLINKCLSQPNAEELFGLDVVEEARKKNNTPIVRTNPAAETVPTKKRPHSTSNNTKTDKNKEKKSKKVATLETERNQDESSVPVSVQNNSIGKVRFDNLKAVIELIKESNPLLLSSQDTQEIRRELQEKTKNFPTGYFMIAKANELSQLLGPIDLGNFRIITKRIINRLYENSRLLDTDPHKLTSQQLNGLAPIPSKEKSQKNSPSSKGNTNSEPSNMLFKDDIQLPIQPKGRTVKIYESLMTAIEKSKTDKPDQDTLKDYYKNNTEFPDGFFECIYDDEFKKLISNPSQVRVSAYLDLVAGRKRRWKDTDNQDVQGKGRQAAQGVHSLRASKFQNIYKKLKAETPPEQWSEYFSSFEKNWPKEFSDKVRAELKNNPGDIPPNIAQEATDLELHALLTTDEIQIFNFLYHTFSQRIQKHVKKRNHQFERSEGAKNSSNRNSIFALLAANSSEISTVGSEDSSDEEVSESSAFVN